jgi:molybdenum-dependent DNA-binding transcriptional regulator ModE
MANLTITVDESTVEKARRRASEEGTSVDALLREYLEEYAGVRRERLEAGRKLLELARNSGAGSGGEGLPKREELYDREIMKGKSDRGPGKA